MPLIAAPYFAELADHVQQSAARRGITLLIDQTGADRERELLVLDGYRTHVIDGLIFSPMALTKADLRDQETDLPTVLLGERVSGSRLVNVAIDNVAAAREATVPGGPDQASGRRDRDPTMVSPQIILVACGAGRSNAPYVPARTTFGSRTRSLQHLR